MLDMLREASGVAEMTAKLCSSIHFYDSGVCRDLRASARNRRYAKLARFTVPQGYMFRHGNSRLTASNVMDSLQLTCAEAPLHKPR
jgi:hypothetical protein